MVPLSGRPSGFQTREECLVPAVLQGLPALLGVSALCAGSFGLGEVDEENRRNDRHQPHPEKAPTHQEAFIKLQQYEVGVYGLF